MEKTITNAEEEDFKDARKLIDIYHPSLKLLGLWPLDPPGFIYLFWLVPYTVNSYFGVLYLFDVWPILEPVCGNIAEFLFHILAIFRIISVRYSSLIPKLFVSACDEIRADYFNSTEERQRYLKYNVRAKFLANIMMRITIWVSLVYYTKPVVARIIGDLSGVQNITYMLPYRVHLFFDYDSPKIYWSVYLIQSFHCFINLSLAATEGVLFTLVFHCCGQLYALQYRIKNMRGYRSMERSEIKELFKSVVREHIKIIEMGRAINKAYGLILLEEFVTLTLVLAMTAFCAVLNVGNMVTFIPMLMFSNVAALLIYAYCYISEALITESTAVNAAFSECSWYDTPQDYKKSLMICIAGSTNSIYLSGRGLCVYSLFQFTDILKSAGAYLSMLRNFQ